MCYQYHTTVERNWPSFYGRPIVTEEGRGQKPSRMSSRYLGGKICSIYCRASCLAAVNLEETVEFILFFQIDRGKTESAARNRRDYLCLGFCPHPSSMPIVYISISKELHLRWIFWDVKAFLYGEESVLEGLQPLGFLPLTPLKHVRHVLNKAYLNLKKNFLNQSCGAEAGGAEIIWDLEPKP